MPFIQNGFVGLMTARQQLAAYGYTWVVTTPTPGTGVAYAQLTSWSATANGLFAIYNGNAPASGRNIVLDRLTLYETAAIATGTWDSGSISLTSHTTTSARSGSVILCTSSWMNSTRSP